MTPKELIDNYGRAELGVDGNCGYALLGEDIQIGECEFVEVTQKNPTQGNYQAAARLAFSRLRERLDLPELCWYADESFFGAFFEPRIT